MKKKIAKSIAHGFTRRIKSYKRGGKWYRISPFTGKEEPLVINAFKVEEEFPAK